MSWSKNVIKTGKSQGAWLLPSLEEADRQLRSDLAKKTAGEEPAPEPVKSHEQVAQEAKAKAQQAGFAEGKASGYKTGFQEGHAQGLSEGRSEGMEQIQAEMAEEKARHAEALRQESEAFAQKIREFTEKSYEELRKAKEEVLQSHVNFALEVARRTVQAELKQSPDAVLAIAQNALRELHQGTEFRVLVSPSDLEFLESNRQTILETLSHIRGLEIAPDRTIQGGCMVESESGTIDARIESYLTRMVQSVLKEGE